MRRLELTTNVSVRYFESRCLASCRNLLFFGRQVSLLFRLTFLFLPLIDSPALEKLAFCKICGSNKTTTFSCFTVLEERFFLQPMCDAAAALGCTNLWFTSSTSHKYFLRLCFSFFLPLAFHPHLLPTSSFSTSSFCVCRTPVHSLI